MRVLLNSSMPRPKAVMGGTTTGPRPKSEPVRPGKRSATDEERRWMDWITEYGCIACRLDGCGYVPACVHHILRGGQRMGHLFTLPLCPGHHQHDSSTGKVARHPYKARFEATYGLELDLLQSLKKIYQGVTHGT